MLLFLLVHVITPIKTSLILSTVGASYCVTVSCILVWLIFIPSCTLTTFSLVCCVPAETKLSVVCIVSADRLTGISALLTLLEQHLS